jgi:hypothetical protein
MIGGMVMVAVTILAVVVLVAADVPRWWRVLVAFPALGAALGIFQARAQTCVALAARGLENMDDGDAVVGDDRRLSQMRVQSRQVYAQSVTAAAIVTVLALIL